MTWNTGDENAGLQDPATTSPNPRTRPGPSSLCGGGGGGVRGACRATPPCPVLLRRDSAGPKQLGSTGPWGRGLRISVSYLLGIGRGLLIALPSSTDPAKEGTCGRFQSGRACMNTLTSPRARTNLSPASSAQLLKAAGCPPPVSQRRCRATPGQLAAVWGTVLNF